MNRFILKQHLFRAWRRHWALQLASVTVMSLVLLLMNVLFLGLSVLQQTVGSWSDGLEMIVYLKDATPAEIDDMKSRLSASGNFSQVKFVSKTEATQKFLQGLGSDSLALLEDPKWKSPIPASLELRLSETVSLAERLPSMQRWGEQLRDSEFVEDVFYGQGWVENFSQFLVSLRGVGFVIWALSLSVGLLIVSNCIRLSFMQRYEEIAILELVGATARFIRLPFIFEGFTLGLLASGISLILSYSLHSIALDWVTTNWSFWVAIQNIPPLQTWHILANLATGLVFGTLGAWNCVRRLNTGWAAVP